jgi:hypothetical protein
MITEDDEFERIEREQQYRQFDKYGHKLDSTKAAAKRPWQGLTDEEIEKIWFYTASVKGGPFFLRFARAIEAKLKERNT